MFTSLGARSFWAPGHSRPGRLCWLDLASTGSMWLPLAPWLAQTGPKTPWLARFGCSVRSWAPCWLDFAARKAWPCAAKRRFRCTGAGFRRCCLGCFDLAAVRSWAPWLAQFGCPGRYGAGHPGSVDLVANECPNDAISKKKTSCLLTTCRDSACLARSATMLHASNLVFTY